MNDGMSELKNDNAGGKKWIRPELTILVRTNPEERVLTSCKFTAEANLSALADFVSCAENPCVECFAFTAS